MSRSTPRVFAWCLAAVALSGCGDDGRTVVPNRVLDRPLDTVLACIRHNGSNIEVLSLNQCRGASSSECVDDSPRPQLVGFVANSERNELAMFRRCDKSAALVDLDPEAPGYNFVPAGKLPSALTITNDSCRVLSANVGSCDLTVLDVAGMGAFAISTNLPTPEGADPVVPDPLPQPSTVSSTLVPRRADGQVLASSPGDILAVPPSISLASDGTEIPTDDDGGDDSDSDDGSSPDVQGLICDIQRPASVYVTFPSCQLVAEIALGTQQILQSRQFVTNDDGEVEIIDSGTNPLCPIDCPAQFDGDLPDEVELVDPSGVFPTTLELVLPIDDEEAETLDEAVVAQVTYPTLFVGGPGSSEVYEIEIDPTGQFSDEALSLPLEGALGVQGIRATPPMNIFGSAAQFLYVIAGDGSTHVVRRDPDSGSLGVECDTQIDPSLEAPAACIPLNPNQVNNAINRRPFAVGPGIRASGGATINDWVFHQVTDEEANEFCAADDLADPTTERARTPFCIGGVVGVGITSVGTVIYSSFGQFDVDERVSEAVDPLEIMSVQVRPHSLWPAIDPFANQPLAQALPLVADEEPGRAIPSGEDDSQALSPSLRQIDIAYAAANTAESQAISSALGGIENVDRLGRTSDEEEGLYESAAARVVVRDFQQWGSQLWTLEWEPVVPGTPSSTGLLECDRHGGTDPDGNELPGATCRNVEPDDARLVDEGAAFCEDGVLAGDKLALLGCNTDDGCGLGQRCLREPTAPSTSTGICVSELAFENERDALREDCAPFITDPCGSPTREYRITRATDNELWLQSLDQPLRAIVRDLGATEDNDPEEAAPDVDLREYETRLSCAAPVVHVGGSPCQSDGDCFDDPYDLVGEEPNQRGLMQCEFDEMGDTTGQCRGDQPDGGCGTDEDCRGLGYQYMCVESICRAPCDLCAPPTGQQPPRPCDSQFTVEGDLDAAGNPNVYTQECLGDDEVCVAGVCHVPCDDGNPGCLVSPLPGPRCFPELSRYAVRLHESFSFAGGSNTFLNDRVVADVNTGECVEDPQVSSLLTSRIRVGRDAESTFGTGPWQIPDCENADEASPEDPNPCRIVGERSSNPEARFHTFRYRDVPVGAIRYSTPVMTVVIDLVSLVGLVAEPGAYSGQAWPPEFANFLRSRIPRGYRQEFATANGFVPFNEPVVVVGAPLVYPVRIVRGPELFTDFIVDAGGRGGVQGIRGQVVRIDHSFAQILPDENFLVR